MAHAFSKTDSTEDVIRQQLGMKPEEFDKKFLAWNNAATKTTVDGFDRWKDQIKSLTVAATAHRYEGSHRERACRAGISIREFVEPGSAYELIAEAYKATGNDNDAADELLRYSHAGGRNPKTLEDLAALLSKQGKTKESAQVLERLIYIAPWMSSFMSCSANAISRSIIRPAPFANTARSSSAKRRIRPPRISDLPARSVKLIRISKPKTNCSKRWKPRLDLNPLKKCCSK